MLVEFILSIEVEDDSEATHEEIAANEKSFHEILNDMEEVIAKRREDYPLNDAEWNYIG